MDVGERSDEVRLTLLAVLPPDVEQNWNTLIEPKPLTGLDATLFGRNSQLRAGPRPGYHGHSVRWHPEHVDDFWRCELDGAADIKALYAERFFFGCEADDRMNGLAFAEHLNPFGARIGAMLGSDIGHWDVADMTAVVAEAHELVDDGLMTPEHFRSFACDNAIALHASTNPAFFDGTAVADYARGALTR